MLYRLISNNIVFESTAQENKSNYIIKDAEDIGADLQG